MKRTGLYLPEQQLEQLRAVEQQTGLSVSEHVRRAISEYLEKTMAFEVIDTKAEYASIREILKNTTDSHLALFGLMRILETKMVKDLGDQALLDEIQVRLGLRSEGPDFPGD